MDYQVFSFCFRSAYKSEQGELFFGYIGGLVSFSPDDIIDDTNKPTVLINNFELLNENVIFNNPVEDIKEIYLSYFDNSFVIDFIALNYDSPENNQYAYILDGFDDNWHYCNANESFTRYTNIPSGEYTFKVKASNSDGVWNEEGTSLRIIISTPFWKAVMVYINTGCSSIAGSYFVYQVQNPCLNHTCSRT